MRILHLSDTGLSGSPIRLSRLLNKQGIESRHIVWEPKTHWREFDTDLIGSMMSDDELRDNLEWADVLHFHNRWCRQKIFDRVLMPMDKKMVIQIHSPRESENFKEEISSGIPIACIAQYHPRQWSECKFIVPNVVDIDDYRPTASEVFSHIPRVSYSPSNANGSGWDDKSYSIVAPVLKRMKLSGQIAYDLIFNVPHSECIARKRLSDIGIDEVSTGSYHMSSLEYLAMGVACIGYIDEKTERIIKDLTGASWLPWFQTKKEQFQQNLLALMREQTYVGEGRRARQWMEQYWNPAVLTGHYKRMYEQL